MNSIIQTKYSKENKRIAVSRPNSTKLNREELWICDTWTQINRDRHTDGSPGAKLCVGSHYITKNNVT